MKLSYNEITENKIIVLDGVPHEVLSSHVFRKQQRKPVNAAKLRNIVTGKVTERAFHPRDVVDEAKIETKKVKYIYENRGEWWFCKPTDPSNRFEIKSTLIGERGKFLKPNTVVEALMFDERLIGLRIPIKVDLKVTESHPAVRGDTSKAGTKEVTLETGAVIQTPMFIKEGDVVRINTETGEYTDRV